MTITIDQDAVRRLEEAQRPKIPTGPATVIRPFDRSSDNSVVRFG